MANPRLDMRRTKEILRLKWEQGLSHRKIASALGISAGVVGATSSRAQSAGVSRENYLQFDEAELELKLYGAPQQSKARAPLPPPEWIAQELKRPGVTLELLHIEYLQEHPQGYRYTAFCGHYKKWKKRQRPSMRQEHRAGEKLFIDYAGKRPSIIDRSTGELRSVELFVACFGASNYTYAEATASQKISDWIGSHTRALQFFGGAPKLFVPDQLKSAVTRASSYEPQVHRSYQELAQHYNCVVIPARPRKPKDKAKVEVAVQIVERWIVAKLRNEQHFTLAGLNLRIKQLLEELNDRPSKKFGGRSRRDVFESIEKHELRELPQSPYEYSSWKSARVNIDYHIEFDRHFYSVPHQLVHEKVDVRATRSTIEVYLAGKRVASHRRGQALAGHTTDPQHMPLSHRAHKEWSPSRLISWGKSIGPSVGLMVQRILLDRPHPEMGYRSCLGILRLEKVHGAQRLELACAAALRLGVRSYQPISSILKNRLENQHLKQDSDDVTIPSHENVRGPGYFH